MKHADQAALARLTGLLVELRKLDGLKEKSTGVFYRKSRAFLHFHVDGTTLFADLRLTGNDFIRHEVTTKVAQAKLLRAIKTALDHG